MIWPFTRNDASPEQSGLVHLTGLTGHAGEVFEAFGERHVREFSRDEYGPMLIEEPDYDLLDNWNHWAALLAVVLAIAVFVGWQAYNRKPADPAALARLKNECAVLWAMQQR